MKKNVKVRDMLGKECNIEDAILLREIIRKNQKNLPISRFFCILESG